MSPGLCGQYGVIDRSAHAYAARSSAVQRRAPVLNLPALASSVGKSTDDNDNDDDDLHIPGSIDVLNQSTPFFPAG